MKFITYLKKKFPVKNADKDSSDKFDELEKESKVKDKQNQVERRETYFKISCVAGLCWICFVMSVVSANGLKNDPGKFSTSDGIVIALISSSIIAPLTLIGKSLFDRSKD